MSSGDTIIPAVWTRRHIILDTNHHLYNGVMIKIGPTTAERIISSGKGFSPFLQPYSRSVSRTILLFFFYYSLTPVMIVRVYNDTWFSTHPHTHVGIYIYIYNVCRVEKKIILQWDQRRTKKKIYINVNYMSNDVTSRAVFFLPMALFL